MPESRDESYEPSETYDADETAGDADLVFPRYISVTTPTDLEELMQELYEDTRDDEIE